MFWKELIALAAILGVRRTHLKTLVERKMRQKQYLMAEYTLKLWKDA